MRWKRIPLAPVGLSVFYLSMAYYVVPMALHCAPGGYRAAPEEPPLLAPRAAMVSVVDVAAELPAAQVLAVLRLAGDERIVEIDDRAVDGSCEIEATLRHELTRGGRPSYLDLSIDGERGSRRLLVLRH
jgi:hypothetical protein